MFTPPRWLRTLAITLAVLVVTVIVLAYVVVVTIVLARFLHLGLGG